MVHMYNANQKYLQYCNMDLCVRFILEINKKCIKQDREQMQRINLD